MGTSSRARVCWNDFVTNFSFRPGHPSHGPSTFEILTNRLAELQKNIGPIARNLMNPVKDTADGEEGKIAKTAADLYKSLTGWYSSKKNSTVLEDDGLCSDDEQYVKVPQ